MALTSHLEYLKFHYPLVHMVIQALICTNYTSTGAHTNLKAPWGIHKLKSTSASYTNNVEPMRRNYKSIGVAYNKKGENKCIIIISAPMLFSFMYA
jgi:hypothetical protein